MAARMVTMEPLIEIIKKIDLRILKWDINFFSVMFSFPGKMQIDRLKLLIRA